MSTEARRLGASFQGSIWHQHSEAVDRFEHSLRIGAGRSHHLDRQLTNAKRSTCPEHASSRLQATSARHYGPPRSTLSSAVKSQFDWVPMSKSKSRRMRHPRSTVAAGHRERHPHRNRDRNPRAPALATDHPDRDLNPTHLNRPSLSYIIPLD